MEDDLDDLRCCICLDFFKNPAIIPCGHIFCKDCITGLWDKDVRKCRCPQCKQTFSNKLVVTDWQQMKELSEKLMKMRPKAEEDDDEDEVSCDSCTSRRTKAVQSCLTCVSSFCRNHLEKHNDLHGCKKHLLTEATDLQSRTCSLHEKLLDVFCRTDQKCVCVLCAINEHKNHESVSASEERADRQTKLMETREKFLQNIKDREKDFKELKQTEESITCSAQTAVSESERIFSEVLCSVQNTSVRVKELITERQRDELSRIEGLQEKVQQKISELRMKVCELDQFMTTEDHIHFLQNYPECTSEEFEDISNISENPKAFFHNVELLLSKIQERLLDVTKDTEIKIKSGEVVPPKADAPVSSSFIDFGKKDRDWVCEVCTVRNDCMSSRCARCSQPNPNMKSKNAFASAPTLAFGSSLNQPATAGFKGTLYGGFNQSKKKASSVFSAPSTRSSGGFTFGYKF